MGNRTSACCSGSMCPRAGIGDNEFMDDMDMCDPAGAVFPETLEDLNGLDRLLLSFCSSVNLAAVRWLFALGANYDACDTNGTTCLHAACRSGSLAIVCELIRRGLPLNATDVAGWAPMHVAFFMGRRKVGLLLMRSGAELMPQNLKGLAPAELCSDAWLREAISSCAAHRRFHGPDAPWKFARESQMEKERIRLTDRLRFEPFFVPRQPVLMDPNCTALLQLGVQIFNQRPGQGLAFLVATGAVRDFPIDLSSFMLEQHVSPIQVGEFLGESFSLSQTLRLEYVNSITLSGTGVVGCLEKVFKDFQIPSDLHKIDRLVDGIAQIWWRQHEQLRECNTQPKLDIVEETNEVQGLRLMHHIANYDALHQLMLSTILLHWNLHTPLPPSQRISKSQWLEMNAEPEGPTGHAAQKDMLRHIQGLIYDRISHGFLPQLQIWSSWSPGVDGRGIAHEATDRLARENATGATASRDCIHGWAMLVGGGFPTLAGSSGTVTYRHVRSILSEGTSRTMSLASPNTSRSSRTLEASLSDHDAVRLGGDRRPEQAHRHGPASTQASVLFRHPGMKSAWKADSENCSPAAAVCGHERVWLSLQCGVLFLAPKSSDWAPYAFVHMRDVAIRSVDKKNFMLTLAMGTSCHRRSRSAAESFPMGLEPGAAECAPGPPQLAEGLELSLIFLLPDGRWQVIDIPHLQIQLADLQQLQLWRQGLEEHICMAEPGGIFSGSHEGDPGMYPDLPI